MQPWFTAYFFDIGHPCYDQLTPVKTRYRFSVNLMKTGGRAGLFGSRLTLAQD